MTYFNRRNNYQIEYSGHEDVSKNLRSRIYSIINKFTTTAVSSYGSSRPWSMQYKNLIYVVQKEFPSEHPLDIVENGDFVKFFTVVEIFWDAVKKLQGQRSAEAQVEMFQAFILSGSVYQINLRNGKIELIVEKDFAEKLKKTEYDMILKNHDTNEYF